MPASGGWGLSLGACLTVLLLGTIGYSEPGYGHALQPGYLELNLSGEDEYRVVWKVPVVEGRPMEISAELPERCEPDKPTPAIWDGTAYLSRWTTFCQGGLEGGLEGGTIRIDGLDRTTTDVLVRFQFTDGVSEARRLTPETPSFVVPTQPGQFELVQTYLLLGVDHILTGFDHLLFVLALVLLVRELRGIVFTVTAFTVAHSLTLAGATLGLVHVPGPPVEAVIALSIVFVAAEILRTSQGQLGLTARYPWGIAFAFGLLHGFGFAGALAEIGLPQDSIPIALLFFNIGIEIGQLLFVVLIVVTMAFFQQVTQRIKVSPPEWTRPVPAYAIGSIAVFWTVERIASFWS
jgi:hydrogenase/urease accessory protein HupE